jgi:hypothetical protein
MSPEETRRQRPDFSAGLGRAAAELDCPGEARDPTSTGVQSRAEPEDAVGWARENGNFVAASNRWSAAMPQPNDLSRSLVALDQNSTIMPSSTEPVEPAGADLISVNQPRSRWLCLGQKAGERKLFTYNVGMKADRSVYRGFAIDALHGTVKLAACRLAVAHGAG